MKSLKVNQIEKNNLSEKEMSSVKGGNVCNCACCYRNVGGSSLMIDDGNGGCRDYWRTE